MDPKKFTAVKMAVQEIIVNAIEHGNLGITFSEKSEIIEGGDYGKFQWLDQYLIPLNTAVPAIRCAW